MKIVRVGVIVASLLALSATASGTCRKVPDDAIQSARMDDLVRCSVAEARKLEPSGEPAQSIGLAVRAACNDALMALSEVALRCRGPRYQSMMVDRMEGRVQEMGEVAVVKARADRANGQTE